MANQIINLNSTVPATPVGGTSILFQSDFGSPTANTSAYFLTGGADTNVQINSGGAIYGDFGFTYNKTTKGVGGTSGLYIAPSIVTAPILTITQVGAAGVVSYSYTVIAIKGNISIANSGYVTTTTGNATLNGTNYNSLSWTAVSGATSYTVYRMASSGAPATTGTLVANTTALTLNDTGLAVLDANTYPISSIFTWSQNGYIGISSGLQIGPPWSSLTNLVTVDTIPFNHEQVASLVQINLVTQPLLLDNKSTALAVSVDAVTNPFPTPYQEAVAIEAFAVGRSVGNTGKVVGIQSITSFDLPGGQSNPNTQIGNFSVVGVTGSGNLPGTEGMFGYLSQVLNGTTGTVTNSSCFAAECGSIAAGVLSNIYFFNINSFPAPGTGTFTNAYGFYNSQNLGAAVTGSSYSFYAVDQGTAANHWQLYTLGQTPSSLGGQLEFRGSTSGAARIGVTAIAGTPNPLLLPAVTGTVSQVLTTNGANPQQLSWASVPQFGAAIDLTAQSSNLSPATLLVVGASGAGMYRASAYVVETTAASANSTLPTVQIIYTDNQTGAAITLDATPVLAGAGLGQTGALTANTIGTAASGVIVLNVKASTTVQYQTVNYASTGPGMQYALHIKLEAM